VNDPHNLRWCSDPLDTHAAAIGYFQRGITPLRLPPRSKAIYTDDWQKTHYESEEDLDSAFPEGTPGNIGGLLGDGSACRPLDTDLDCREAIFLAKYFLPPTRRVSGRKSARRSHYWYRAAGGCGGCKKFVDPMVAEDATIAELRGNGCQTVLPPSIHPDEGESYEWDEFGEPSEVEYDELLRCVADLSAAALLARYWPGPQSHKRQDTAMALAGGLLRAGWSVQQTAKFLDAVATTAGETHAEVRQRVSVVTPASVRLANKEPVVGWPRLAELMPDKVVSKAREWLGLREAPAGEQRHEEDGQAEAAEPAGPEPWDDPLPLGEVPEVGPFPLDVLPEPARGLVQEIAWAMNCAPDLAAVALLALASGAIANSRHLAVTRTHIVSPCLYAVVVAPPGATKSPPLRLLRHPFDQAEAEYRKEWKARVQAWKDEDKDERGAKPTLRRCLVGNITTESLSPILDENPRGVLMIRNELSGMIAGLNQYKNGGDDRQFYLDLWDGTPIITDRKSDRAREGAPIFVLNAFTSIYGTIQSDVVGCLRQGGGPRRGAVVDDGFLDRFLFSCPEAPKDIGEQWREVSEEARTAWEDAVRELLSLSMRQEPGKPERPVLLALDGAARHSWEGFTQALADEVNAEDFPPHLRGPWAKLRSYGARLALILRCLRWAYSRSSGDALGEVDGPSMDAAARLVDYFKSHTRRVHCVLDADPRHRDAGRVLRWITNSVNSANNANLEQGEKVVSVRDVHREVLGSRKSVDDTETVLSVLVRHGYLRPILLEAKKGPGRRPSPRYEAHPCLFTP
jgi:hypothetical protein